MAQIADDWLGCISTSTFVPSRLAFSTTGYFSAKPSTASYWSVVYEVRRSSPS